jgi:hypothetical protein
MRSPSNPPVTQLYNAVKLSGRTRQEAGHRRLQCRDGPDAGHHAQPGDGTDSSIQTEPLANYNLFVLDQAFKGRSFVTLHQCQRDPQRKPAMPIRPHSTGAFYNKQQYLCAQRHAPHSNIFGYTPYSSAYFYNTDTVTRGGARYLKPYERFSGRLRFAKVSGTVRYYGSSVNVESANTIPTTWATCRHLMK